MPFVNEIASEEDIVRYGLREQDLEFFKSPTIGETHWTIDREQNSYLRHMKTDGRDEPVTSEFIFNWHGHRVNITLETVSFTSRARDYAERTVRLRITHPPQGSFWLPQELMPRRAEIIADFKQALVDRKGMATWGDYKEYKFNFEF